MASSRKRILINGSYGPSLINFRGDLISDLIAAGHDVHVSAPDISCDIHSKLEAMRATVHEIKLERTGFNALADMQYFLQLRSLILEIGADRVINYTIKPNIYGGFAAASVGVKCASMITGLGYAFYAAGTFKHKLIGSVSRLLYRFSTNANSVVIFQNLDDQNDFINAKCLSDPGKARLVNGSGVDTKFFVQKPLPDEPVFLLIARLLVSKGVREYAQAAKLMKEQRADCRFLLAGFIDQGPDAIKQEELDQWQRCGVEYLGPLDDVRGAISMASVYVLPSYREGTPRTVLEAMAMGRPIITSDAPGCRETVNEGETGLLVEVQNVLALSSAMTKLADNRQIRESMGNAARALCEKKYDVEQVNRTIIKHLNL